MAEGKKNTEKVVAVNGNMITIEFTDRVMQNEVAFARVGDDADTKLKSEVIRVRRQPAPTCRYSRARTASRSVTKSNSPANCFRSSSVPAF